MVLLKITGVGESVGVAAYPKWQRHRTTGQNASSRMLAVIIEIDRQYMLMIKFAVRGELGRTTADSRLNGLMVSDNSTMEEQDSGGDVASS